MKRIAVIIFAILYVHESFGQNVHDRIKQLEGNFGRYLTFQEYNNLAAYRQIIERTGPEPAISGSINENLDLLNKTVLERIETRRANIDFKYVLLINHIIQDDTEKKNLQEQYNSLRESLKNNLLPETYRVLDQIDTLYATRYLFEFTDDNGYYTVIAGDCLWKIAYRFYHDGLLWPVIHRENLDRLKYPNNPDLILPGENLRIPKSAGGH
jgi:nucleoid-associated protein YgaU